MTAARRPIPMPRPDMVIDRRARRRGHLRRWMAGFDILTFLAAVAFVVVLAGLVIP